MTKLNISLLFNYSLSNLPLKLSQTHNPPFGPKAELTIENVWTKVPSIPAQYNIYIYIYIYILLLLNLKTHYINKYHI